MIASVTGCLILAGEVWLLLYVANPSRFLRACWRHAPMSRQQIPAQPYTAADAAVFRELEALLDPARLVPEPVARNLGGETHG